MDKNDVIEKVKKYADVVCNRFEPSEIILFGSFAKGNAQENSDIDVAVIMNAPKGDHLNNWAQLFELSSGIDDRIEPLLLYETDDRSGFLQEVKRTGYLVYSTVSKRIS